MRPKTGLLSVLCDRLSGTRRPPGGAQYIACMKTESQMRSQCGFTLYELLITVVIVGVILSFGIANMSDFTRNGRMTATANDMHSTYYQARSESARTKNNTTICASTNPMAAAAQCGNDWNQGYIVFTDLNGDISVDPGEAVLKRQGPVETGVTLTAANGATYFSFSGNGVGRGNVGGQPAVTQMLMCDERGNVPGGSGYSTARLFVMLPLGRGHILRDESQIQTGITAMGASCP